MTEPGNDNKELFERFNNLCRKTVGVTDELKELVKKVEKEKNQADLITKVNLMECYLYLNEKQKAWELAYEIASTSIDSYSFIPEEEEKIVNCKLLAGDHAYTEGTNENDEIKKRLGIRWFGEAKYLIWLWNVDNPELENYVDSFLKQNNIEDYKIIFNNFSKRYNDYEGLKKGPREKRKAKEYLKNLADRLIEEKRKPIKIDIETKINLAMFYISINEEEKILDLVEEIYKESSNYDKKEVRKKIIYLLIKAGLANIDNSKQEIKEKGYNFLRKGKNLNEEWKIEEQISSENKPTGDVKENKLLGLLQEANLKLVERITEKFNDLYKNHSKNKGDGKNQKLLEEFAEKVEKVKDQADPNTLMNLIDFYLLLDKKHGYELLYEIADKKDYNYKGFSSSMHKNIVIIKFLAGKARYHEWKEKNDEENKRKGLELLMEAKYLEAKLDVKCIDGDLEEFLSSHQIKPEELVFAEFNMLYKYKESEDAKKKLNELAQKVWDIKDQADINTLLNLAEIYYDIDNTKYETILEDCSKEPINYYYNVVDEDKKINIIKARIHMYNKNNDERLIQEAIFLIWLWGLDKKLGSSVSDVLIDKKKTKEKTKEKLLLDYFNQKYQEYLKLSEDEKEERKNESCLLDLARIITEKKLQLDDTTKENLENFLKTSVSAVSETAEKLCKEKAWGRFWLDSLIDEYKRFPAKKWKVMYVIEEMDKIRDKEYKEFIKKNALKKDDVEKILKLAFFYDKDKNEKYRENIVKAITNEKIKYTEAKKSVKEAELHYKELIEKIALLANFKDLAAANITPDYKKYFMEDWCEYANQILKKSFTFKNKDDVVNMYEEKIYPLVKEWRTLSESDEYNTLRSSINSWKWVREKIKNYAMDEKNIDAFADFCAKFVPEKGRLEDEEVKQKVKTFLQTSTWFSEADRWVLSKPEFIDPFASAYSNLAFGIIGYFDEVKNSGRVSDENLSDMFLGNIKYYLQAHKKEILELIFKDSSKDIFKQKIYQENERFWKLSSVVQNYSPVKQPELIAKIIEFDDPAYIVKELQKTKDEEVKKLNKENVQELKDLMYRKMFDGEIGKKIWEQKGTRRLHAKNKRRTFGKPKEDITYSIIDEINKAYKLRHVEILQKYLELLGMPRKKAKKVVVVLFWTQEDLTNSFTELLEKQASMWVKKFMWKRTLNKIEGVEISEEDFKKIEKFMNGLKNGEKDDKKKKEVEELIDIMLSYKKKGRLKIKETEIETERLEKI